MTMTKKIWAPIASAALIAALIAGALLLVSQLGQHHTIYARAATTEAVPGTNVTLAPVQATDKASVSTAKVAGLCQIQGDAGAACDPKGQPDVMTLARFTDPGFKVTNALVYVMEWDRVDCYNLGGPIRKTQSPDAAAARVAAAKGACITKTVVDAATGKYIEMYQYPAAGQ